MNRAAPDLRRVVALGIVCAVAGLAEGWVSEPAAAQNWEKYFDRTDGRPPRPILIEALERFEAEGRTVRKAVDAGCGTGIDTLYMLERGIAVHAFDYSPEGIQRLRDRIPPEAAADLRAEVATFHEAAWEPGADLVFAGFSLPFARPEDFDHAWPQLVDSLADGGRFAGHLFGDRDDWAAIPGRTHHTREQVEALLGETLVIEVLRVVEEDKPAAAGREKHWHYFEIIARKPSAAPTSD